MSLKRSLLYAVLAAAAVGAAMIVPTSSADLSPMPTLFAQSLNCDLTQYKSAQGLTAAIEQDLLVVSWQVRTDRPFGRDTRSTTVSL